MHLNWQSVLLSAVALPMLLSTAIVAQDATARERHADGSLAEARNNPAQGDAAGYTRQGYGHVRQGNTSSADDPYGRMQDGASFAPYGAETADEIKAKIVDRAHSPQGGIGIDLKEPRRIQIPRADGTVETYWYVLFRVENRMHRKAIERQLTPSTDRAPGDVSIEAARRYEGVPFTGSIDLVVEAYRSDVNRNPSGDELAPMLEAEARAAQGVGLSETTESGDAERAGKISAIRYGNERQVLTSVSDPFVLKAIAKREGLWAYRDGQREYLLYPMSAFQRDLSPARSDYSGPKLLGPRLLPIEKVSLDDDGNLVTATRYPAVFSDGSHAGWYGQGDELPDGAALIDDPALPDWGALTTVRYQDGDVVDRFGRPLSEFEPGYLDARNAGGLIVRASEEHDVTGNLEELIGNIARGPAVRVYNTSDRVLFDWNSGVPREGYSNQNWMVNGKIVTPEDQAINASLAKELQTTGRGPHKDKETGPELLAAAASDRYATAVNPIGENSRKWGLAVVGQPVKLTDRFGRAIKRALVTYRVGEMATEAEWKIWLQRFPGYDSNAGGETPWTRPLTSTDLLVGKPKIKLGMLNEDFEFEGEVNAQVATSKEVLKRLVGDEVVDYETGRRYSPRYLDAAMFARDADGTYHTRRHAPIPSGVDLFPGEDYTYAPLGSAMDDSLPVPTFDQYGAWADYISPVTGKRVPLLDAEGTPVLDEMGQPQYVKDYQYEWLYAYDYAKEAMESSEMKTGTGGTVDGFRMRENVPMWYAADGTYLGLALMTVYENVDGQAVFKRLVLEDDTSGDERIIGVDKTIKDGQIVDRAPTITVRNASMPQAQYVALAASARGRWSSPASASLGAADLVRSATSGPELGQTQVLRTYDRWTLPPPFVTTDSDGNPVIETRLTAQIGRRYRGEANSEQDSILSTVELISERWGAFVFRDLDEAWDYMNVAVRGLNAPVVRKGMVPSDNGVLTPKLVRQDWIYHARYERLGDEYGSEEDYVRPVRKRWFLLDETDIGR